MTEFETATLAFQQGTLAFQQGTLAFQQGTLAVQEAALAVQKTQAWITLGIGLGQILLIAWGLSQMRHASIHRDNQHHEAMRALEELIRRTAPPVPETK
jgi:hypothetical protein